MTAQVDRTRRPFAMDEAVAILARTPATLDALLRGLPDGWIVAHEGGDTWSPFDVIHMILLTRGRGDAETQRFITSTRHDLNRVDGRPLRPCRRLARCRRQREPSRSDGEPRVVARGV